MSLREAAEKALEALEYIARYGRPPPPEIHRIIDALRTALAEAEAEEPVVNIGPEWKPCVKLPITVHVREQRAGETHISTREGITPVKPDDLIMRGVAGEEYPISRELFKRTYRMEAGAEPDEPVAWMKIEDPWGGNEAHFSRDEQVGWTALYTHPPRREPLTAEAFHALWRDSLEKWRKVGGWSMAAEMMGRAIERAHGIGGDE